MKEVRLGTRGSQLALAQAERAQGLLEGLGFSVERVIVKTQGDRDQTTPLTRTEESVGWFVSALEDALRREEIDLAVHSLKDMPILRGESPELPIVASLERNDPRDVLVLRKPLCDGMKIGTGSPRRIGALHCLGKKISCVGIRGNLDTRIGKVTRGEVDGIMVAACGLERLNLCPEFLHPFEWTEILPAPGQGVVALQSRRGHPLIGEFEKLNHRESSLAQTAERACLEGLGGGCHLPLGAYAEVQGEQLTLHAVLYVEGEDEKHGAEGYYRISSTRTGKAEDAEGLGRAAASEISQKGNGG